MGTVQFYFQDNSGVYTTTTLGAGTFDVAGGATLSSSAPTHFQSRSNTFILTLD